MQRSQTKYDHMKARCQWLNYTPKTDSSISGKKRFAVNKNVNSSQFQQILEQGPVPRLHRQSLPSITKTSKKINELDTKKEAEVQVGVDQFSKLEQQLKEKEAQISILQNMFSQVTHRLDHSPHTPIKSRVRHKSIIDQSIPSSSANNEKSSVLRNSSMPSIRSNKYIDFSQHPAFFQPKFTKSRPKIVLTNPITGVLPFY
jgi:hypothetical protein